MASAVNGGGSTDNPGYGVQEREAIVEYPCCDHCESMHFDTYNHFAGYRRISRSARTGSINHCSVQVTVYARFRDNTLCFPRCVCHREGGRSWNSTVHNYPSTTELQIMHGSYSTPFGALRSHEGIK